MSEIAEELERLAEEFEVLRSDAEKHAQRTLRMGMLDVSSRYVAAQTAHGHSVRRLRARAAEIRTQRSASTYAPQSKPDEVRVGQWWHSPEEMSYPIRIETTNGGRGYATLRNGALLSIDLVLVTTSWLYLGNGPEPARR